MAEPEPARHAKPLHEPDVDKGGIGRSLRDVILGGQDGLVNVLGLVLGVAAATAQLRIIVAAALAATFSESIAMGGVMYTSALAERDYYLAQLAKEQREVEEMPDVETEEVRQIFRDKGLHGDVLERVVGEITSDKKVWVDVMMRDELHLTPVSDKGVVRRALVTGFSTLIGSLIPLVPFLFVPLFGISVGLATIMAVPLCAAVLFGVGAYKALTLVDDWRISGLQITLIGMLSAAAGYGIGRLLHVSGSQRIAPGGDHVVTDSLLRTIRNKIYTRCSDGDGASGMAHLADGLDDDGFLETERPIRERRPAPPRRLGHHAGPGRAPLPAHAGSRWPG